MSTVMQCNYLINGDNQCKLQTLNPSGYCHRHKHKIPQKYKFPKPKACPVCFCSIHQSQRPLYCGHWVHRICVQRSGKAECPLCRHHLHDINLNHKETHIPINLNEILEELIIDPDIERIEIPEDAVVLAVVTYQLYAFVICPHNRVLGLDHFISGAVNDIIPLEHPNHNGVSAFLYGEALRIFFDPQHWSTSHPTVVH
jgi:hypothetical protein